MYEHRSRPLLPFRAFMWRAAKHLFVAIALLILAAGVGTIGYKGFLGLDWIDAFLNASMILSGMGPVARLDTASAGAKLFASFYALFSGLFFVALMGVVLAPWVHRLVHKIHVDR
jgi:hypothetical protein